LELVLEALYFPNLRLPEPEWTNPNLLFFDHIEFIAPSEDDLSLFDYRTRDLMEHGLARPLQPERFSGDDQSDETVLGHILGQAHRRHPA
jgi:hypothetical protein